MQPLKKIAARAAVYARYSSDMQSADSADDQIARIRYRLDHGQIRSQKFLGNPIEIISEWVQKDEAQSGRIAGRDGYEKILRGIREKSFDVIIVDDLSRLTRSLGNLLGLYDMLKWYEVELISICDGISSDDPSAKTFFTVKGMVNDFSNDIHAERVIRGMEMRMLSGFSCGDHPYGYDSAPTKFENAKGRPFPSHYKLSINEFEAQIIRRIFHMYSIGLGYTRIAKALNEDAIPSPGAIYAKNGKTPSWSPRGVQHILQNEKYIGIWKWKKTKNGIHPETKVKAAKERPVTDWVSHQGNSDQKEELRIIEQEMWDKVQELMKENMHDPFVTRNRGRWINRKNILPDHPFSGLLECGVCSSNFLIISGKKKGYYGCFDAHRKGTCTNKNLLSVDRIESSLIELVKEKLTEPEIIRFAVKQYNQILQTNNSASPDRLKSISAELDKVETELTNLIQVIISGGASDTVNMAIKEREQRKMRLKSESHALKKTQGKTAQITDEGILERLETVKQAILENPLRCYPILRMLFPKKVRLYSNGKAVGGEPLYSMKGLLIYNGVLEKNFERQIPTNKKGEATRLPLSIHSFPFSSI